MPSNYVPITSIYGRRLGLQPLSSGQTGGAKGIVELVVGPDGFRDPVTTNESTGTAMNAAGVSYLVGTSAASTPVFTLSPPIPGVKKRIYFGSTDSAIYVKMQTGVSIAGTSLGSTLCAAIRSSGGGYVELEGLTTAIYGALSVSSTAVNTVAFQATT